ncbi:MAG: hypothetical protein HQ523_01065 [Lentisphaerae bacterium]|nr:hypothetical protein [Lentisphaerota bacterium]
MNRASLTLGLLVAGLMVPWAEAQDEPPAYRAANLAAVQRLDVEAREAFAGDTNVLVLSGIVADREARRIVVQTEACGLGSHDVAEFFVIAPHSGNDYESLTRALATAGDMDRALRFIGMAPGRCVDYSRYRFWPKGERVESWFRRPGQTSAPWRAESLLMDEKLGKTLSPMGFVYVEAPQAGSLSGEPPDVHPVDADTRGSIMANYNEAFTLFDVPRAAPQAAVYRQQTVNPDRVLEAGERLEWILQPERRAEDPRVQNLELVVDSAGGATQSLATLQFVLHNQTSCTYAAGLGMNDLLRQLTALCQDGRDPFITLRVDDHAQLGALKAFCLLLASIETDHGIRIEPPLAGHLYFKAFIPDDALRDRETRIMQPAELTFVERADGRPAVSLVEIFEHWRDDDVHPELTFERHALATPEALRTQLTAREDGLPILLVFAPATLEHGELIRWLSPVLASHPTVHVFTPLTRPE